MSKKNGEVKFDKKAIKERGQRIKKLKMKEAVKKAREERLLREEAIRTSDETRVAALSKEQKFEKGKWYKLDNAGLIFPAMYLKGLNPNFTLTVILKEKVDPINLQKAVNDVVPRFAPITATLKKSMFWHYLSIPKPIVVQKAPAVHNYRTVIDGKTSMTRFFYKSYEISLSVFHAACDGYGGLMLFNSVLNRYFELTGKEINDRAHRLSYKDKITLDEVEDAYQRFADKNKYPKDDEKKTYSVKGTKLTGGTLRMIKGSCEASKINLKAKEFGLTVTQLLNAALLYALQKEREFCDSSNNLPICVCSAVNLRKLFPTNSLRNFSSYVSTTDQGETTLEGLFKTVKQQYEQKMNVDYFRGRVNFNVNQQRNFFVKIMPLAVKNFVMGLFFNIMGKKARTTTLSNLGIIAAPKDFEQHIVRYEAHMGDPAPASTICAAASFNDILCITFSRNIEESIVEKEFFRTLSGLGIEFAIESNLE